MRLRLETTELILVATGVVGLIEQEAVRVIFTINPNTLISGICFAFVLIGAGVTVGRNFKIGPLEIQLKEKPERPAKSEREEG